MNKGQFRAFSDSLCCGTVHLTLTHTHQGTQGARYVAKVRIPDSSSHISRARSSSPKLLNKLRKGDHKLQSPNIDDSSDTMSDISDFRWWTSISTRQCVTCLNLKYPLMLLQGRQEHVLENAEGTAGDGNQPSKKYVSCVVPTVQRVFSTRTWTGWKSLSRARASRDHCRKTISECEKGGNSGLVIFLS